MVIQIYHLPGSNPPQFQVQNLDNGKRGKVTAGVPDPVGFAIPGWPDVPLLRGLQWYLEKFLKYPFEPETLHADKVQEALKVWGSQAFDALFDNRESGGWFSAATAETYAALNLQIVSDDPGVLAWPWEALYDRAAACRLAQTCQVERRLDGVPDPPTSTKKLPEDRVNILLVIARPYGKTDVRFRSVARPLVEWAARPDVPAYVHVLRPPTFDNLRDHLRQHPGFYHILHFDGHGSYGDGHTAPTSPHILQAGIQGRLVFENAEGDEALIAAENLSELLRETALPAVVLNACQSAMLDERADDPFASVAAALLKAGMQSVTAMAYSLYVSAAQQFLPAFYKRLFENGRVTDAARAGRQQMLLHPERACARGAFPMQDWLIPVVYQQADPDFRFVQNAPPKPQTATRLPEDARDTGNPYGFFGRDGAILQLERALRRKPAAILISGMGGVGKTTLARGFLHWLEQTGGLDSAALWVGFADVRSVEYVLNRMGEPLFGSQFVSLSVPQKFDTLVKVCREHPLRIVWDNFESARGVPGSAVTGTLTEEDCALLREFLAKLYGGPTKVLITSRSPEDWLGAENRYPLNLGGLDGEERWDFANSILHERGLKVDRSDPALNELMDLLGGHPLAMRVLLLRLEKQRPAELLTALRRNIDELQSRTPDAAEARLFATLRFATDALPAEWQPLLLALAQHEGFVEARLLVMMAQQVDAGWTDAKIGDFLGALSGGGLLREIVPGIWETHPAVTGYLRSAFRGELEAETPNAWVRWFVNVMGSLAGALAPLPLHEQRLPFKIHGANLHSARSGAKRPELENDYGRLTTALAAFAQNTLSYRAAEQMYQEVANYFQLKGKEQGAAAVYHQLGIVAQERRDFKAAEGWYDKSLEITERLGVETLVSKTYHQLGTVAQERRDFEAAERWYHKSLEIEERQGDEHGAASSYHQLGRVAEERRDFEAAERWYHKSLEIEERRGNEHGAAISYHQLGMVAAERRDFEAAERWYHKSLEIEERQGDEHGAAGSYHQLGMVAEERRDFEAAERWYHKSLEIEERQGNEHGAAISYHQLGMVAAERRDFEAAERWYHKSLEIAERQGDEHGAAGSYHQLGMVAEERRDFEAAERWYHKSLEIEERQGNEHGAAISYHQLGMVAAERRDFEAAERWFQKALAIYHRLGDPHNASIVTNNLARLAEIKAASDTPDPPKESPA